MLKSYPIKAYIRMDKAPSKAPSCGECRRFRECKGGFPSLGYCTDYVSTCGTIKHTPLTTLTFDDCGICQQFELAVDA